MILGIFYEIGMNPIYNFFQISIIFNYEI